MFLAAKAVLATRAVAAYRESAGPLVEARDSMVEARWARLTEWHVFDRADGRLRHWLAAGAPRQSRLLLSWAATVDGPNITTSRTLSVVRNFLQVHQLAFAARVPRPGEREWVLWSDIRFCWNPDVAGAPRVEPDRRRRRVRGWRARCGLARSSTGRARRSSRSSRSDDSFRHGA